MDNCDCYPGNESNGWQEERCEHCKEQELKEWKRMLDGRM